MEQLQQAIPVLAALNIEKTVNFYNEKPDFDKIGWTDDHYAVMGRYKIEIHFWKSNNKIHPEHPSCHMHVTGVGKRYTEMDQVGVVHPNGPLKTQPWGMREFAILDEDANMIKFGERIRLCS